MRNTIFTTCAVLSLGLTPVQATEKVVELIPQAQEVGQARLTYMIWDVYDMTLYAPEGKWQNSPPYALEISYLRSLTGQKIADRSTEEMRKQGFSDEEKLATWQTQMRDIFPDVKKGTVLTGLYQETGETIFFQGDTEIGRIADPAFGKAFFGIWLSENTSEPDLRRKLLSLP